MKKLNFSLPAFLWKIQNNANLDTIIPLIGIGLFCACLTFYYSVLEPLKQKISLAQVALIKSSQVKRAPIKIDASENTEQQLAHFYQYFPQQEALYDSVGRVYAAATAQNLEIEQGEYRFSHDRTGKLLRYAIVIPVKGSYPQIRKFITQSMLDVPSLGLDGITFNRQKIDDQLIEAKIKMTLFARPE